MWCCVVPTGVRRLRPRAPSGRGRPLVSSARESAACCAAVAVTAAARASRSLCRWLVFLLRRLLRLVCLLAVLWWWVHSFVCLPRCLCVRPVRACERALPLGVQSAMLRFPRGVGVPGRTLVKGTSEYMVTPRRSPLSLPGCSVVTSMRVLASIGLRTAGEHHGSWRLEVLACFTGAEGDGATPPKNPTWRHPSQEPNPQ